MGLVCQRKNSTNTSVYIEYLLNHLASFNVDTASIIIQTDNGTEFVSGAYSIKQSLFTTTINSFKATHITIPPASPTYNSDVESSHKLIEHECYAKMTNPTFTRFLQQSAVYLDWCNHTRYNAYKKGSPRTLLQEKHPAMDTTVLTLTPCIVDTFLTKQKLTTWLHKNFAVY